MSLVNDFEEFLVDSCQIKNLSAVDKAGQITFAAPITYACFVTQKDVLIKGKTENDNIISKLQIYIDKNPTVEISDIIIYDGKSSNPKDIQKVKEFNVPYSTIIYT